MILYAHLIFGAHGNAQGCLGRGWSVPEAGFSWAIDGASAVRLPRGPGALALEIDLIPFVHPPLLVRQRLEIWAGESLVGAVALDRAATLCLDVPAGTSTDLVVTLVCPDAISPALLGIGEDTRRLGVMVTGMRLLPATDAHCGQPRTLGPLHITEPSPKALDAEVRARCGLVTADMLRHFESLGHNCEFGLMQRDLDAEPLGLLRFGGIEPAALLAGLECAFAGIDNPDVMGLESGRMNGRAEYLVRDFRFGVRIHTGQFLDEVPPDAVDMVRMSRHLGFLVRHFADVLREASRIFVLHHPDIQDVARALPVLNRLRAHGDNALLYVTEHPTVPPGTLVQERTHLYHGYIDRLVPMKEATKINLTAWTSLCASTYSLVRMGKPSLS